MVGQSIKILIYYWHDSSYNQRDGFLSRCYLETKKK